MAGLYFIAEGLLAITDDWEWSLARLADILSHEAVRTEVLPGVFLLLGYQRIASKLLPNSSTTSETTTKTKFLVRLGAMALGVWLLVVGASYALGSLLAPALDSRTESETSQYEQVLLEKTSTKGFSQALLGSTLILSFYFRETGSLADEAD